jgi:hypothetical protein
MLRCSLDTRVRARHAQPTRSAHLQCEQAVGVAEVVDVARLGDLHEVLPGAALAVAGRAPAGHVALGHEVLDDLRRACVCVVCVCVCVVCVCVCVCWVGCVASSCAISVRACAWRGCARQHHAARVRAQRRLQRARTHPQHPWCTMIPPPHTHTQNHPTTTPQQPKNIPTKNAARTSLALRWSMSENCPASSPRCALVAALSSRW